MAHKARAKERASTLQDQEMHQYYQPWLAAHGSAVNVAFNVGSIAAQDLQEHGYKPRGSRDRALGAFAQLATWRLNVKRAMVSLIDSNHQYILTEATKTMSLMSDRRHGPDDELWLGNTVLLRDEAVCHHTFTNSYTASDDNGIAHTVRGLVVNDCRLDERFKDRSYVTAEPGVRFYAGVPIITRSGHVIGTYAVSDESPRNGLSFEEFRFMQDVASAILEHLEWARDRVDRFKGERIVRGLANFIDSSPLSHGSRGHPQGVNHPLDDTTTASSDSQDETIHTPVRRKKLALYPSRESREARQRDMGLLAVSDNESVQSDVPTKSSINGKEMEESVEDNGLTKMLGRAARILRKSTLADGVAFFSIPSVLPAGKPLASVSEGQESDYASTSESSQKDPALCEVLGISFRNREEVQHAMARSLTVAALENYFKAYPDGKTLRFTTHGYGIDSDDETTSESPTTGLDGRGSDRESMRNVSARRQDCKRKNRMSHTEILQKLPGVRTMIFLPLRDIITGKCIAGGFLWTSQPGRMMGLDDNFSYLRAFATSIANQIAREHIQNLDRAKTTFIASMSHELRSPLHGILGSVEFLQDTTTDSYQTGLVTSIANCSRTLLDTLSNLLSYAKVSTIESVNAATDVDLGALVEEVVEAVCAGHTFKKLHSERLAANPDESLAKSVYQAAKNAAGQLHSGDVEDSPSSVNGAITVFLDISPSVNWNVTTSPGALRRIIMNLVGNALKYTESGFIAVSLRAKEAGDKIEAVFQVTDSGKGISETFQRYHLFKPFKQENTFASGTGLGLSIVKQLVDSLSGSIKVNSVAGRGTQINVYVALNQAEIGMTLPEDELLQTAAKTKGMRLCVLDPNGERENTDQDHIKRLDTVLGEMCSTWFGMEITKADNMVRAKTDMFLYTEPPSLEYLLEHHSGSEGNNGTPLIIVCMNATEAISISNNQIKELSNIGTIVEVIPQPCGPRKLARVLSHCLSRIEAASKRSPKPRESNAGPEDLGPEQQLVHQDQSTQVAPEHSPAAKLERQAEKRPRLPTTASTQAPAMSLAVALPSGRPDTTRTISTANEDDMPSPSPSGSNGFNTASEAKTLHILIVDDNKINVDLLMKFVRKFKLTSVEAYNGQEAVDAFKKVKSEGTKFDCVLMDISMPVMDGIEATKKIREMEQDEGLERTKIIALSAFASQEMQREATAGGVDLYMPKPVKFAQLKDMLLRDQK